MSEPSVSIITVTYNSVNTVKDTIKSVLEQTYPYIEYIIIDGASTDGTIELVKTFGKRISRFVSEPDLGIYDAINKGIRLATSDLVGVLNSDDYFVNDHVIERVARSFDENNIDAVYGDVQFVKQGNSSKIVRYYSSKRFNISMFRYGFMPAHPSFYARRVLFESLGFYKTDYEIAADYELLIRFLYINRIKSKYIEMPFVSMRTGGVSTRSMKSNFTLNKEIARACHENGIDTNYLFIYSKYFLKIFDFWGKRQISKS